jgi:hypothetical protein
MKHTDEYQTGYLDALKDLVSHVEHTQWIRSSQAKMLAKAIAEIPKIGTTDEV